MASECPEMEGETHVALWQSPAQSVPTMICEQDRQPPTDELMAWAAFSLAGSVDCGLAWPGSALSPS